MSTILCDMLMDVVLESNSKELHIPRVLHDGIMREMISQEYLQMKDKISLSNRLTQSTGELSPSYFAGKKLNVH